MKTLTSHLFTVTIVVILISFTATYAQDTISKPPNKFWKRVSFGGGIGLNFGNNLFNMSLAPNAVYQINLQFGLGVGLNGIYVSSKDQYKSVILGGSVLGLFNPYPELQISGEFEELYVNRTYDNTLGIEDDKYWYPALFVGAGYRVNKAVLGVRFDVLYNEDKSIYGTSWMPFVRIQF